MPSSGSSNLTKSPRGRHTKHDSETRNIQFSGFPLPSFLQEPPNILVPYLSKYPSKRAGEWFFLWYSVAWITWFGIIVVFKLYEGLSDLGYNLIGLSTFLPCILIPILFPSKSDQNLHWYDRFAFKANIWVAGFQFVGNYFWTHYFFALLGASYTFPIKYHFNKIPPVCFLLTQAYFLTYHSSSNLLLRLVYRKMNPSWTRFTVICLLVLFVSSFWSLAETVTIASFPYYSFKDRARMYTIGTFFYALYFIVSFPMYFRMEEQGAKWTWKQALLDGLAAAMIVFILCDFWRLIIGNILTDVSVDTLPFLV